MAETDATVLIVEVARALGSLLLLVGAAWAVPRFRRKGDAFLGALAAGLVLLALPGLITPVYNWWLLGLGSPTTPEGAASLVYLSNTVVLTSQVLNLVGVLALGIAAFVAGRPAARSDPAGVGR